MHFLPGRKLLQRILFFSGRCLFQNKRLERALHCVTADILGVQSNSEAEQGFRGCEPLKCYLQEVTARSRLHRQCSIDRPSSLSVIVSGTRLPGKAGYLTSAESS